MKKNKTKKKKTVEILYDPYRLDEREDFSVVLQRYIDSSDKTININGVVYYQALQIINMYNRLIAALDNLMKLKLNDIVIDELGNEYIVKEFAMFRLLCDIPEWYRYISFVNLKGNSENMGKYFTKKLSE
ncbi:MAG: hypothetical protein K2K57_07025 [Oscillospiraceae bacterium]|nr:hypothetical protein [Oscillospiraceae bacterium]